ncbi:MAG: hypothetical protein M9953_14085, partial [Thermomicrobiales bacterium]|nr:hypothetical protein [Thermomicrobiales bacterium]
MSENKIKQWARARMEPESWNRIGAGFAAAGRGAKRSGVEVRHWIGIGSDTVTSFRTVRLEPWRLVFAIVVILVPMTILSLLPWTIPTAILIAILFALILLSTYAADWVGGLSS